MTKTGEVGSRSPLINTFLLTVDKIIEISTMSFGPSKLFNFAFIDSKMKLNISLGPV